MLRDMPESLPLVFIVGLVVLSWPATGSGAELQSTPDLTAPITWTAVTNGLSFSNGSRIYRAPTVGRMFYRLRRM